MGIQLLQLYIRIIVKNLKGVIMNRLDKVLYYISQTDTTVIQHCSQQIQNSRRLYALLTIAVAFMTFVGGYHLIVMMLQSYTPEGTLALSSTEQYTAGFIALNVTVIVTLFNMNVMATGNRMLILPRVLLSLALSLLVSFAIIMALSESTITQKIYEGLESKITVRNSSIQNDTLLSEKVRTLRSDIARLKSQLQVIKTKALENSDKAIAELEGRGSSKKRGKGENYKTYMRAVEKYENEAERLELSISKYEQKLDVEELAYAEYMEQQEKSAQQDIETLQKVQSVDFFTQGTLFLKIIDDDVYMMSISVLIALVLIGFDLYPTLLKLLGEHTEYEDALKNRTALNIQIARVKHNEAMERLLNQQFDPNVMTDIYQDWQK